jgi:RsiW-degrading membrane proteinase PrsW (M82 family)
VTVDPQNTRSGPKLDPLSSIGCAVLMLSMTGFGLLCTGLQSVVLLATSPQLFMLAVALATICTVPHTLMLLWLDRHEGEPLWLIAGAFLWGAVASTALASIGNGLGSWFFFSLTQDAAISGQLTASMVAPLTEETTKAFALVALFVLFRREVDNVLDGIIYGALIGLGFAWFENITYYMNAAEHGPVRMLELGWIRGVLNGAGGHATFTGLTGLGFGLFRVMRKHPARWLFPPLGLAAAMFAHATWNTFCSVLIGGELDNAHTLLVTAPVAVAILQLPFLLFLFAVAVLVLRHEDRLIREHLATEPPDVAFVHDILHLVPARNRMRSALATLLRRGPIAWWRHYRLANALVELAFARWHHVENEHPWPADEDAHVHHWRDRIRTLRGRGATLDS